MLESCYRPCVEILGKPFIYHAASVYLAVMGTWWNEKWKIVNGIFSCRKCTEFSQEEMILYKREFQYQGCKLWSLLNSMGYQTINIHIYISHFSVSFYHLHICISYGLRKKCLEIFTVCFLYQIPTGCKMNFYLNRFPEKTSFPSQELHEDYPLQDVKTGPCVDWIEIRQGNQTHGEQWGKEKEREINNAGWYLTTLFLWN